MTSRRAGPLVAALVLVLPLLLLYRWQSGMAAVPAPAVAGSLRGQALIQRQGETTWQSTAAGNVSAGDAVRAVDTVRLAFSEGTVVEMQPGALVLVRAVTPADGAVTLEQQAGRLSVDTINPRFQLQGPELALTVARARYAVEVGAGGAASVTTEQGLVTGTIDGEAITVAPGESLRTGSGQRAKVEPAMPAFVPPPPPTPIPVPRPPTPTPTRVPPTPTPQIVHVIVAGDTLYDIAVKYGTTVDEIVKANNIQTPNRVAIGTKLVIPGPKK
jgi:LysM repeat protein